jgi:hypothetical protein
MDIKFFAPTKAPHPLGENLARNFCKGEYLAAHGEPLARVNLHYGILYGGAEMHEKARQEGKHFVHVDHAFFGRNEDLWKEQGYFRFSLDHQSNGQRHTLEIDRPRLAALQSRGLLKLEPRQNLQKRQLIVYQPPSHFMVEYFKLPADFDAGWRAEIRTRFPGMMVVTLHKSPKDETFWENTAIVASFNSGLGFEALRRGKEAIMTAPHAIQRHGVPSTLWPYMPGDLTDLKWAERRFEAFCTIAGRMWNFQEMRNGKALEHMQRNGEIP